MKSVISTITKSFYTKAISDIFLGYHFNKIIAHKKSNNPLSPSIDLFEEHLQRINSFWESQLLGRPLPKNAPPFDLISIHKALNIKRGEIGRWVTLFNQTVDEHQTTDESEKKFLESWKDKVKLFETKFLNYF